MDMRPFPERVLDGIVRRGVRLPSALTPAQEHAALGSREAGGSGSPRGVGGLDQLPPLHRGPLARADEACDRLVDPARKMFASIVPCALYMSLGGGGGIVPRRVGGENHGGAMGGDRVIGGDKRLCRMKLGGLALLSQRYRGFGRSARCSDVLSRVGRGGVECEARTLGAYVVLRRLGLAALGIDPETLKASRPVDPLPLPSLDSAKGLSTVDWTSRPPHVRPWYLRSWQGAAAARRPRRLEVRPGVVPDVLERAVELGSAPADDVSRL